MEPLSSIGTWSPPAASSVAQDRGGRQAHQAPEAGTAHDSTASTAERQHAAPGKRCRREGQRHDPGHDDPGRQEAEQPADERHGQRRSRRYSTRNACSSTRPAGAQHLQHDRLVALALARREDAAGERQHAAAERERRHGLDGELDPAQDLGRPRRPRRAATIGVTLGSRSVEQVEEPRLAGCRHVGGRDEGVGRPGKCSRVDDEQEVEPAAAPVDLAADVGDLGLEVRPSTEKVSVSPMPTP